VQGAQLPSASSYLPDADPRSAAVPHPTQYGEEPQEGCAAARGVDAHHAGVDTHMDVHTILRDVGSPGTCCTPHLWGVALWAGLLLSAGVPPSTPPQYHPPVLAAEDMPEDPS
jgi:hypothetical protein